MQNLEAPFILVASPQLKDPNFVGSVVLMLEHKVSGSLGFVLNKKTEFKASEILRVPGIELPDSVDVWYGGPMQTQKALILFEDSKGVADKSFPKGLGLGSNIRVLDELSQASRLGLLTHRFCLGYAGWGKDQLVDELVSGAWLSLDFDPRLVFETSAESLWETCMKSLGVNATDLLSPDLPNYIN